MGVVTLEGIVEHGQIRLKNDVRLPEKNQVYVVIPNIQPNVQAERRAHIYSPRLTHPEQAVDFEMQIIEESPDANG